MIVKDKELIYNKGTSNKFYYIKLEKQTVIRQGFEVSNYVVMAEYGRIGNKPRTSIKTPIVCSKDKALEIFDKIHNSKVKSGYEDNEYKENEKQLNRTATSDEIAAAIERLTLQEI